MTVVFIAETHFGHEANLHLARRLFASVSQMHTGVDLALRRPTSNLDSLRRPRLLLAHQTEKRCPLFGLMR
jgi:hypothetical protein